MVVSLERLSARWPVFQVWHPCQTQLRPAIVKSIPEKSQKATRPAHDKQMFSSSQQEYQIGDEVHQEVGEVVDTKKVQKPRGQRSVSPPLYIDRRKVAICQGESLRGADKAHRPSGRAYVEPATPSPPSTRPTTRLGLHGDG